jgi:hypothetical protein
MHDVNPAQAGLVRRSQWLGGSTAPTDADHVDRHKTRLKRIDGWISIALFVCAAAMLVFFMTVAYRAMLHSDAAMKLLVAEEMARQFTLFPRGWNFVQDLPIIFPSLIAAPLSFFFAPSFPLHAVVDVVAAALVLYAAYVASRAVGISRPLRWFVPTILASGLSPHFVEAVFGQSAYSGPVFILLLISGWSARYLSIRTENASGRGGRGMLLGISLLIAGAVAGGPRGLATYAVPMLVALLAFHSFTSASSTELLKRTWKLLAIITFATAVGGMAFLVILKHVTFHPGGTVQSFASNAQIVNHMGLLVDNWLELFDALPPPGQRFGIVLAGMFAARLGVAVLVFFLPLILLLRFGSLSSPALRFLVLLQASLLAATSYVLLFTGIVGDEVHGVPRYLVPLIPIALLVTALWLSDTGRERELNGARIGWMIAAAVLALASLHLIIPAFTTWPWISTELRANPRAAVVDALETAGLHRGFASYWNASVLTVLSGANIRVAPVALRDDALMTPFHHLSAERWYSPDWAAGPTFLLFDAAESARLNRTALEEVAGKPASEFRAGGFDVLVFPSNIGTRLGFSAQPFVVLPKMDPKTCGAEYAVTDPDLNMRAGEFGVLHVHATNRSSITWSQNSAPQFNPGLRILDKDGKAVGESRAVLPRAIGPGESVSLAVPFKAPPTGEYKLYFSFVAEGDAWCGELGANWAKASLSVKP